MGMLRKLIALDVRLVQWLADRMGFWRIDVIWHLARATGCDDLAAQLQATGLADQAARLRAVAAQRRGYGRQLVPARAPDSWRRAVA